MKLHVIVSELRGGGAERVAADLASAWSEEGHEVALTFLTPMEAVEYRPANKVKLSPLAQHHEGGRRPLLGTALNIVRRIGALGRAIRQEDADVVIAVQANIAIEVALACLFDRRRLVGCEHNNPRFSVRGRVWTALRPLAYQRLETITVLTGGARDWFQARYPKLPVRVVPNPVQWPLPSNRPVIAPDTIVAPGRRIAFAAGRFAPAKAFDQMVKAAATIAKLSPDIDVVIAGDGPLRPAVQQKVAELGLEGRVHLPGRVGNMPDWYSRSDVFVMSSLWEGMPMVMLEAMSSGLPVVCYDFDYGPRDILRSQVDGVIVPQGDAEALGKAVVELINDTDRLAAMGAEAQTVRERFGRKAIMKTWSEVLDSATRSSALA